MTRNQSDELVADLFAEVMRLKQIEKEHEELVEENWHVGVERDLST